MIVIKFNFKNKPLGLSRFLFFVFIIGLITIFCTPGCRKSTESYIADLRDNNSNVRSKAAKVLGKRGDKRAVEPLVASLKDERDFVRYEVAKALEQLDWQTNDYQEKAFYLIAKKSWEECVKIGEPAVESLIAILEDDNDDIRRSTIETLGKIGDSRAFEPLISMLDDDNDIIRRNTIKALGELGDTRAVEILIAALNDKDWFVRLNAADALGKLGDTRAVEPLIAKIEKKKYYAAEALGKLGDARAVKPLIAMLGTKELGVENTIARGNAAKALVEIGAPSVDLLISMLDDDDDDIRSRVVKSLGEIGDARAVKPLIAMLGDDDEDLNRNTVRQLDARTNEWNIVMRGDVITIGESAGKALLEIGSPSIEPLVTVLGHSNHSVRVRAAAALDKLGWQAKNDKEKLLYCIAKQSWEECVKIGKPAVEPLIAILNDNNKDSRRNTVEALGEIEN